MLSDHYVPPEDFAQGTWVGRAWLPGSGGGPAVVVIDQEGVFDISASAATVSALLDLDDPVGFVRGAKRGARLGSIEALIKNSDAGARDESQPWLLAPI